MNRFPQGVVSLRRLSCIGARTQSLKLSPFQVNRELIEPKFATAAQQINLRKFSKRVKMVRVRPICRKFVLKIDLKLCCRANWPIKNELSSCSHFSHRDGLWWRIVMQSTRNSSLKISTKPLDSWLALLCWLTRWITIRSGSTFTIKFKWLWQRTTVEDFQRATLSLPLSWTELL